MKPHLLFLSPTPVFDLQGKSGKEVVALSLQSFSAHFQIDLIAPGQAPQINQVRFHKIRSAWFNRMKSIPVAGHLFNYFYIVYLWFTIKSIIRKHQIKPDIIYMTGPWMSLIGQNLFPEKHILKINRYYGISIPANYNKSLKNKLRFALKISGYRKSGDLVVMTNDGTQGDQLLLKLGVNKEKIRFWENGIHKDSELIERQIARNYIASRWNVSNEKPVLLTVSRLAKWKRVDRAISLLEGIQKKYPDAILIIAGDGEEKERLIKMAVEKGLINKIVFTGSLMKDELNQLYRASDVFITLYDLSNAGNPLFESMLNACCIYTFDSPDVRAYLDEESAVLNPLSKPDIHKLIDILSQPEKRISLGNKARIRAMKKLTSWDERIYRETNEILAMLKKKKSAGS